MGEVAVGRHDRRTEFSADGRDQRVDAVESGLRESVLIPDLTPSEETRNVELKPARAREILDHVERFEYASRDHVIVALLWHLGIRIGTLRAIDVSDVDLAAQCIELRHRPETGTPLKNKGQAERSVAVSEKYCKVILDYMDTNRHEVTDDYGRDPLVTSVQGRLTSVPIRRTVYKWTLPCKTGECPHDRDPKTCEWTDHDQRSKCPSSVSPHAVRRGSITEHLRREVPQRVVEDRTNVSGDVLDQHYDERSERERMEQRRKFIDTLE